MNLNPDPREKAGDGRLDAIIGIVLGTVIVGILFSPYVLPFLEKFI